MDKTKKPLIAVILLMILIAGYILWNQYGISDSQLVEASGTVEATTVELMVKVPGTVEVINAEVGDQVTKGDLIAVISRNDLLAQRERDALNVAIAQNKLNDLLSGARSQQIQEAQANINIKRVTNDKAQKDLERAEALFKEGSIAESELEVYQNNYTVAVNQLEAAQANLSLLLAGSSNEQIKSAENQVKLMEAVLKGTEAVLSDLNITTPLSGALQSRNFEIGEYVTAGTKLASVVNLDKVWINVFIPTDDLPYIKIGEIAQFQVSGLDRVFSGKISEIATRGEFTPKTIQTKKERTNIVYKVKIEVDNSDGVLKPGMPADVMIKKEFNTETAEDGLR